jgi:hypothetical protein
MDMMHLFSMPVKTPRIGWHTSIIQYVSLCDLSDISDSFQSTYTLGLVNTSYNIGGIVSGFFFGGPVVGIAQRHWSGY